VVRLRRGLSSPKGILALRLAVFCCSVACLVAAATLIRQFGRASQSIAAAEEKIADLRSEPGSRALDAQHRRAVEVAQLLTGLRNPETELLDELFRTAGSCGAKVVSATEIDTKPIGLAGSEEEGGDSGRGSGERAWSLDDSVWRPCEVELVLEASYRQVREFLLRSRGAAIPLGIRELSISPSHTDQSGGDVVLTAEILVFTILPRADEH
jgi:hypothetical protein